MNADKPIESPEFDLFRRDELANKLAKLISEKNSGESLVIGLYGKWGTGKSSLLNLIACSEFLKYSSENHIIIRYNPWLFSSKEQIIHEFFREIVSSVLVSSKKAQKKKGNIRVLLGRIKTKIVGSNAGLESPYETIAGLITHFAKGIPYVGEGVVGLNQMVGPTVAISVIPYHVNYLIQ
jgi:predicted KAP-like P-loop ATPase